MIILGAIPICLGMALAGFGLYAIVSSMDPLGYFPPNLVYIPLAGLVLIFIGIIVLVFR